jgi:hypothetical protein
MSETKGYRALITNGSSASGTIGGVVQVLLLHAISWAVQYHAFLNNQGGQSVEYCKRFKSHRHSHGHFHILHKYTPVLNTMYCDSMVHPLITPISVRDLDALADRLGRSAFKVNEGPQGPGRGHRGGGG